MIGEALGTVSTNQGDVECFRGEIKGGPYNTCLAAPVIGFTGEANDPAGRWTVRVSLKDQLRTIALPLETSFVSNDKRRGSLARVVRRKAGSCENVRIFSAANLPHL